MDDGIYATRNSFYFQEKTVAGNEATEQYIAARLDLKAPRSAPTHRCSNNPATHIVIHSHLRYDSAVPWRRTAMAWSLFLPFVLRVAHYDRLPRRNTSGMMWHYRGKSIGHFAASAYFDAMTMKKALAHPQSALLQGSLAIDLDPSVCH